MLHKLNKEFDIRVNLQGIWSLGPVNPTGFARRKIYISSSSPSENVSACAKLNMACCALVPGNKLVRKRNQISYGMKERAKICVTVNFMLQLEWTKGSPDNW